MIENFCPPVIRGKVPQDPEGILGLDSNPSLNPEDPNRSLDPKDVRETIAVIVPDSKCQQSLCKKLGV